MFESTKESLKPSRQRQLFVSVFLAYHDNPLFCSYLFSNRHEIWSPFIPVYVTFILLLQQEIRKSFLPLFLYMFTIRKQLLEIK